MSNRLPPFLLALIAIPWANANGEIRTVHLAPAAPGAPVRIDLCGSPLIVERDTFPRAERDANPATFAPVAKDIYLEALDVLWLGRPSCFGGLGPAAAFAPFGRLPPLLIVFHMPSKL